jgi:hypothetical protein
MHNYFIVISVVNPDESSYGKYHTLSFLMSQTQLLCYTGHFGAKTTDFFLQKSVKLLPANIGPMNHQ